MLKTIAALGVAAATALGYADLHHRKTPVDLFPPSITVPSSTWTHLSTQQTVFDDLRSQTAASSSDNPLLSVDVVAKDLDIVAAKHLWIDYTHRDRDGSPPIVLSSPDNPRCLDNYQSANDDNYFGGNCINEEAINTFAKKLETKLQEGPVPLRVTGPLYATRTLAWTSLKLGVARVEMDGVEYCLVGNCSDLPISPEGSLFNYAPTRFIHSQHRLGGKADSRS